MSRKQKMKFKRYTLFFFPVILMLAVLVPAVALALSGGPTPDSTASQQATIEQYIDAYIQKQFTATDEGEAGFYVDQAALKSRIDSNGDNVYLGEGDDAANAPVLVDNLATRTDAIPTTSFRCTWNSDCFAAGAVSDVKALVDAHQAAGFSTDVIDYCQTDHTAAPTTAGWGIIAQTGALATDGSIPNVYNFKWGRKGWVDQFTDSPQPNNANPTKAADTPAGGQALPTPPADNCDGSATNQDLVRCSAAWAISSTGGNVGNGVVPGGTSPNMTLSAMQIIDVRADTPAATINDAAYNANSKTYQVPLNTLFNTGLAKVNPTATTLIASRSQSAGGIAAMGLKMLGYTTSTGGYIHSGVSTWNATMPGIQTLTGHVYALDTVTGMSSYGFVDNTPPTITVAPSVSNITGSAATFSWSTSEPTTSKVEIGTSPGSYFIHDNSTILHAAHSGANARTVSGLTDYTTYYYRVTSYDRYANAVSSTEGTFQTADATGPAVSNVLPNGNIYTDTATVSASYSDSGSGINVGTANIDLTGPGGAVGLAGCSVTATQISCNASGLTVGAYTIGGSVADNQGNSSPISGSFNVVDNVAPMVTNTTAGGYRTSSSFTITGTYNDPAPSSGLSTAEVSLDNTASFLSPNPCTFTGTTSGTISCPVSGLADGAYQTVVGATDNSGHAVNALPAVNVTVDTVAPVTTDDAPAGWKKTNFNVTLSCTDATSGCATTSYKIDAGATQTGNTVAINTDGNHTIEYWSTDNAGNTESPHKTVHAMLDKTAPALSNTQPTGTISNASPAISVNYSDSGSGIDSPSAALYLDGNPTAMSGCTVTATSISCPASGLGDGLHNVVADVNDMAGNAGTTSWSFTIDTAAPTISTPYIPANGAWVTTATPAMGMNYSSTGTITDANISIDGGAALSGCTWGQTSISCTATSLTDGSHSIHGTVSVGTHTATADWSVNVDTTPPGTSNVTPSGYTNNNMPVIGFDISDAGSGVDYVVVNVVPAGGGSAISPACTITAGHVSCDTSVFGARPDGAYNVWIDTHDLAGNVGHDNYNSYFTIDTMVPSIASPSPSGWISNNQPVLSFQVSDSDSGINSSSVQATIDGSVGTTCTGPGGNGNGAYSCTINGGATLGDGTHTFSITAEDNAGNSRTVSGASFSVDTTAPTVSNIAPTGPTSNNSPTITADLSDGSGVGVNQNNVMVELVDSLNNATNLTGSCTITASSFSCPTSGLADGVYGIRVNEADTLGNGTDLSTPQASFTVDTAAPSVSNVLPSGDVNGASTISADYNDGAGSGINTATASLTVDDSALTGCTATATGISCPAPSGLGTGTHTIGGSVADNAGNSSPISGSFNITEQDYYFPWYDNNKAGGMNGDWIVMHNEGNSAAAATVYIGDIGGGATPAYSGTIPAGGTVPWQAPATIMNGPVRVVSDQPLLVTQRVIYKDTFNEINAVSGQQLSNSSYFTWYDSNNMDHDWIVIGNPGTSSAAVNIYIGHDPASGDPLLVKHFDAVPAGGVVVWESPAPLMDGPVQVTSDQPIVASQRTISGGGQAFNETTGIPGSDLGASAMFSWYDEASGSMTGDWVLVANLANPGTPSAHVEITIGDGAPSSYDLPAGAYIHPQFPGKMGGPVSVVCTNCNDGQKLISSQRVLYGNSFDEVQGAYAGDMGTSGGFPWYDATAGSGMNGDWVMVASENPGAAVDAYIELGGVRMTNTGATGDEHFTIDAGTKATLHPMFGSMMDSPVEITSNSAGHLFFSQRVIYKNSFNELLGRPY